MSVPHPFYLTYNFLSADCTFLKQNQKEKHSHVGAQFQNLTSALNTTKYLKVFAEISIATKFYAHRLKDRETAQTYFKLISFQEMASKINQKFNLRLEALATDANLSMNYFKLNVMSV